MRQSLLLVAALLAFAMLAPRAALAFDFDTMGAMKPDGTPGYVDPDESLDLSNPKADTKSAAPNGVTLAPGLYLSGSASGNAAVSSGDGMGVLQPMGRLTH